MLQNLEIQQIQQKVIAILKTILDPEVGINIWDFGLIYGVNIKQIDKEEIKEIEKSRTLDQSQNQNLPSILNLEIQNQKYKESNSKKISKSKLEFESNYSNFLCEIVMTFTSVNCPAIDLLPREIVQKIAQMLNIQTKIEIVWSPKWEISLLSEEIQFELGIL